MKKADYPLLMLLLLPTFGVADEKPLLIIGGTQHASNSSYTYLGVINPIWGGKVGQGWFNNTIASWLTYDYTGSLNGRSVGVEAKAPGIESGLGYAWSGPKYALSMSTTLGLRDIGLSPKLPNDDGPEGKTFSFSPQIQVRYQLFPKLDADLISSYAFGPDSSFNRLRFGWTDLPGWRIGVEGIVQHGQTYHIEQQGIFLTKYLSNGLALEISAGRSRPRDDDSSPYFGISFAKMF